jgi:hypothetical protein
LDAVEGLPLRHLGIRYAKSKKSEMEETIQKWKDSHPDVKLDWCNEVKYTYACSKIKGIKIVDNY